MAKVIAVSKAYRQDSPDRACAFPASLKTYLPEGHIAYFVAALSANWSFPPSGKSVSEKKTETGHPVPEAYRALKHETLPCAGRNLGVQPSLVRSFVVISAFPEEPDQLAR